RAPSASAQVLLPGQARRPSSQCTAARSKTPAYRVVYALAKPVLSLLRRLFPRHILTTEELGRAMLLVAKSGARKTILESSDIRDCLNRAPHLASSIERRKETFCTRMPRFS